MQHENNLKCPSVVLKLPHARESPQWLSRSPGPTLRALESGRLGQDLRNYISSKLLDDAEAAGPGSKLGEPLT